MVFSLLDRSSTYSELHLNVSKGELAGIGVLKSVNVALCGMKNDPLIKEAIKILDVHIPYKKNF